MNAQTCIRNRAHLVVLCVALLAGTALGQYTTDLVTPNSIPNYRQENSIWGGAATVQMALRGYPGGFEFVETQKDVWDEIQKHLSDHPAVPWASDPDGVKETLMDLGPAPGVHWVAFSDSNKDTLLWSIAYYMDQFKYPVPVLVKGIQHWVLIVGITTDVKPVSGNTVTLQKIHVFDPDRKPYSAGASAGGWDVTSSGYQWFNWYWPTPVTHAASKWNGEYVAIIEPPDQPGLAWADVDVPREGPVIGSRQAIDFAHRWLEEYELLEMYPAFARIRDLEPLLVNSELDGYYLVPFGHETGNLVYGAILVNAYDGRWQAIGMYPQPTRLLDRDDAVRLALNHLQCNCEAVVEDARLRYEPSMQTRTSFLPVWEVFISHPDLEEPSLLVSMDGVVAEAFIPLPLGN